MIDMQETKCPYCGDIRYISTEELKKQVAEQLEASRKEMFWSVIFMTVLGFGLVSLIFIVAMIIQDYGLFTAFSIVGSVIAIFSIWYLSITLRW